MSAPLHVRQEDELVAAIGLLAGHANECPAIDLLVEPGLESTQKLRCCVQGTVGNGHVSLLSTDTCPSVAFNYPYSRENDIFTALSW